MIDVDFLYKLTNELIRKDHAGGYTSSSEYNRLLALAQETLYRYYYDHKDETDARQSLIAFQTSQVIAPTGSFYSKPNDYKDKLDARLLVGSKSIPVHFPARDELAMTLSSVIRGPDIVRGVVVGEVVSSGFNVWPENNGYNLSLRYYTEPPTAERVTSIDVGTSTEVYDESASTQLSWNANNLQDFVDLLLLFKGVVLRDSSLVQWVQAKNAIKEQF